MKVLSSTVPILYLQAQWQTQWSAMASSVSLPAQSGNNHSSINASMRFDDHRHHHHHSH